MAGRYSQEEDETCQVSHVRGAHFYETDKTYLIMKLGYVFLYLPAILDYGLQLMKDV